MERQNIRKLTVVAYEEGALLALLGLAESSPLLLARVDKVVLVNPLHPQHKLYHNSPLLQAKRARQAILSSPARLQLFQQLRIVVINTHRTVLPEQPQVRNHFHFVFEDKNGHEYQLNNTLVLSSKALHNVESYIPRGEYFQLGAFVGALGRLLALDTLSRLSIRDIEYLLRYEEEPSAVPVNREGLGECRVIRL